MLTERFWEVKALSQLTPAEWEALCDGCGKCCLHKLECEDSSEVFYTDVACRYLSLDSCRCSDYERRLQNVPTCVDLNVEDVAVFEWLPLTCAYRLVAEGQPLPSWHYLESGSKETVHTSGVSMMGKCVSEQEVGETELEERIVNWVE